MDLIQILEQYQVPYELQHHHVSQNWVGVDCPNCSPNSRRYRAAFNLYSGAYNCWQCGKSNPVLALASICRITNASAYTLLSTNKRLQPATTQDSGVYTPPLGVGQLQPQHLKYLYEERRLNPEVVENVWGIKGIGIAGLLSWRLFIPIFDNLGREVSWTTRSISKTNEQRYISAKHSEERIPHKQLLYGGHLVRHSMIIFEGPLDCWAVGPGAVATCGTAITDSQVWLMAQVPVRVVCFDNEPEAQRRADVLCKRLAAYPGTTENVVLETGKDAAEAEVREREELRCTFLN